MPSSGCDILLEDGSGGLLLENGDDLLLEACVPVVSTSGGGAPFAARRSRMRAAPSPAPFVLTIDAVIPAPTVSIAIEINDDEVVLELLAGLL